MEHKYNFNAFSGMFIFHVGLRKTAVSYMSCGKEPQSAKSAVLACEAVEGFADDGLDGDYFVFGQLLKLACALLVT
jgi:hypothetical protein